MEFNIPLAEQKVKPHQVTALHLVVGLALLAWSAIAMLVNNIDIPDTQNNTQITINHNSMIDVWAGCVMVISILIISAALFRNKWLRSTNVNKGFRLIELLLLLGITIYLLIIQFTVLAAVFGILAITIILALFWENNKNKTLTVTVDDNGISPPFNARRRSIPWVEVQSTLLRHGTVTVNCTDNRLYQWVTAPNDIDQQNFETYCIAQIEAAKKDRKNSNW